MNPQGEDLIGGLVELALQLMFLLIPLGLILLGATYSRSRERAHFRDLDRREQATCGIKVIQSSRYVDLDPARVRERPPQLILSECVIGSDYLKTLWMGFRGFFGGRMNGMIALQLRARREALIRCMEAARERGYNALCNVRISSADIGGNALQTGNQKMPMAAILVSATAYVARIDPTKKPAGSLDELA